MSDLSIVVVNWNTRDLLLECLEALETDLADCPLDAHVIVVDNASDDGSVDAVGRRFPQVRCLALGENRGYAGGCNAALREARGRAIALLNSDTRTLPGALARCVAVLDECPDVGVVGPQLLHTDGRLQNSIHAFPGLLSELVPTFLLELLAPRRFPSKRYHHEAPVEVDAVLGAALVVRSEVVRDVGALPEDYFFFLEETDWCWQIRSSGWRVLHVPDARVVHHSGASSKRVEPTRTRIQYHLSLYRFLRRRRGRATWAIVIGWRFARALLGAVVSLPVALVASRPRARCRERWALVRWHVRGCPSQAGLAPALLPAAEAPR